ncbi:MAG: DegT/DnrJ/EryC1/StrS family aminotransferase [Candidatus Omnitrophica bacterium]|nr:DegT/DnrJ/EryC1/StrS family aminotransferase [Candidatus Omnitrophota bacterium]
MRENQKKDEVIIPAYTSLSLVLAIKKAGFKPILCDISLDDFGLDYNLLERLITDKTLCIVGVHMFGIVSEGMNNLKERFPNLFIIEDCAQALGGSINGIPVGRLGDVSFFSFNRGKNLATYGGGCIVTDSGDLAEAITQIFKNIKQEGYFFKLTIPVKILIISLVTQPLIYGLLYPFLSLLRERRPKQDFKTRGYTDFQAKVAEVILEKIDYFSQLRYENGMLLINGLKDIEGIILPVISGNTQPAFNRLPILIKDLDKRRQIRQALDRIGIDTSYMYSKPLHWEFDLGYPKEDFPCANFCAQHILTLPVHPVTRKIDIQRMLNVIHKVMQR